MSKKTIIVGASRAKNRYAYSAMVWLNEQGHETVLLGLRDDEVDGREILDIHEKPGVDQVHTITLYINPQRQVGWYDYLLSLRPKRLIFNPGTENQEFMEMAKEKGVEVLEACTLVMLRTGQY